MPPRVLHVLRSARPSAGAAVVSLSGLLAELHRRGSASAVCAEAGDGAPEDLPSIPADRAVDLARYDLVHIHGWGYPLAGRVAAAARRSGKPLVISPQGLAAADPLRRRTLGDRFAWLLRDRKWFRRAAFIAAANEYEQEQFRRAGIHDGVRILPYGLNFAHYAPGEIPAVDPDSPQPQQHGTERTEPRQHGAVPQLDDQQILVLGDITPDSGCVAVLKCLAELGPDAEGWRVVLAGDSTPKWKSALELAVRRKGAEGRVSFARAADVESQRALLARASLLVCPSPTVRPPIPATQALAAGVPALCTPATAPPDMDSHLNLCGHSRTELRESVRDLLQTPTPQRRDRAEMARRHGADRLDWASLTDRYLHAYESAM